MGIRTGIIKLAYAPLCVACLVACSKADALFTYRGNLAAQEIIIELAPQDFFRRNDMQEGQAIALESFTALSWMPGAYMIRFAREGAKPYTLHPELRPSAHHRIHIHWELREHILSLSNIRAVSYAIDTPSAKRMPASDALAIPLAYGEHIIYLFPERGKSKRIPVFLDMNRSFFIKVGASNSQLTHINTIPCGQQPKGLAFSRDGRYLFLAPLTSPYVEVYDGKTLILEKRIPLNDAAYAGKFGFVELAVSPYDDAVLASKMTTASVHRIPTQGANALEISQSIKSRGVWTKVMAFTQDGRTLAVANWVSKDITVFSYPSFHYKGKINIGRTPRGLAFMPDGRTLYVSDFDSGALIKADSESMNVVKTIPAPRRGALRHIVYNKTQGTLYASDMRNDCVYVYSVSNDTLLTRIPVGKKPNTIALGPDERYLYVSCRGPNAKTSYLDRSPEDGELYMIRCDDFTTIDVRKLGNQPTALAVHPSGEYLAVSNFRDNTIEIYRIDYRYESLARHILL